jgi:hypothetical protein
VVNVLLIPHSGLLLTQDANLNWFFMVQLINQITLYETKTRLYFIGSIQNTFRILKVDRTTSEPPFHAIEDETVYSHTEIDQILKMLIEGNRSNGGMTKVVTCYGIIGMVKFLNGYYISLITNYAEVANINSVPIYRIEETRLIPVSLKDTNPLGFGLDIEQR